MPADTPAPADAERLASIRNHFDDYQKLHVGEVPEKENKTRGIAWWAESAFLLRLLDEREAEIARLRERLAGAEATISVYPKTAAEVDQMEHDAFLRGRNAGEKYAAEKWAAPRIAQSSREAALGEAAPAIRKAIIAELRSHAGYCDTWSGNPKQKMDESDWCRAAANFLEKTPTSSAAIRSLITKGGSDAV